MADEDKPDWQDPAQWLAQFQIPGIDVTQLAESARQDLEALQRANQTAFEGWQALAQKQSEILQETMQTWQQQMANALSEAGQQDPEQQSEFARESFGKAVSNMRELADLAVKSQTDAMDVMRRRLEENLQALFNRRDG